MACNMSAQGESSHIQSLKRGQKTAVSASVAVLFLAAAKFISGYLFDSKILVADAFHSSVDVLAIFASWFGLMLASRKESPRFPYGLYKAETLVTLLVGLFILWAGVENAISGYKKLLSPTFRDTFPLLPIVVSGVSVAVSYLVAKKMQQTASSIKSGSLQANASEAFLDIGTSVVVLAGILFAHARIPYIEGSVIIFIALLILRLGIKNIWTPVLVLLDANLDPVLQRQIEATIAAVEGVEGIKHVKIRQSGPFRMVECEIGTRPSVSVYKAHELADIIEGLISREHSEVESVFVHVEPVRRHTLSMIMPVKEINGLDSRIHGHFGRAPYFIILTADEKGDIRIEDFYYNEFLGEKDRIHVGVKVIKAVILYRLDVVFTSKMGEISFHMLKNQFIDVFKAEENATVRETMEKYRRGEIEPFTTPHPAEESETQRQMSKGART